MHDNSSSLSRRSRPLRPSRAWYVLAAILFVIGSIGGITLLLTSIFGSMSGGVQFMVPGGISINVDRPGKYVLWNEVRSVYNGRVYSSSAELPDMIEIRVTESLTGDTVPMSSSAGTKETIGSTERYAIGNIYFEKEGNYSIEVSGDFRNRIFMIRRSVMSDILVSLIAFLLLSIAGWVVAPVIAVVVLIKRVNAGRRTDNTATLPEKEDDMSQGTAPEPSNDERTWATFCHLGALAIYFFPLAHLLVPLVIWLIKKDEYPFVDDQGKESLNFQISMTIYYIISAVLMIVIVGCVLLVALGIFNLIVVIIASVKANRGERYRYPLCIRFIK